MNEHHPITVAYNPRRVRALYQGHVIADTTAALTLTEAAYKPVIYFPRQDVAMEFLSRTDHHTHCPFKGEASYYSLMRDGVLAENAVWTYEDPLPAVGIIAGYLAFYPRHFEIREQEEPAVLDIDQVVQHTDSGAGASQAEPWPPTVDTPDADLKIGQPFKDTGAI